MPRVNWYSSRRMRTLCWYGRVCKAPKSKHNKKHNQTKLGMPSSNSVSRRVPLGLSSGGKAAIRGLQQRPELNGRLVKLVKQEENGRWKTLLLGEERRLFLAVKPENLLPAPPSALLKTFPAFDEFPEIVVPLACSVGLDGYGNKGVRMMYSEFLGHQSLVPAYRRLTGDLEADPSHDDLDSLLDHMVEVVTSPYREGPLSENECVVVVSKYPADFKELIQYQCLEDTGNTVQQGMHADSRICKIVFPYDIE